ncbi:MAG: hypothetical protein HPY85_11445 [Anaerolineae bacterium]|nr:hypothetical protein [Anaerolineae bacterium]
MTDNNELNNPLLLNTLLYIARSASPGFARWLLRTADRMRGGIVPLNDNQRKMIANLQHVFGDAMSPDEYKRTALRCFYLRSIALYDYYHHVTRRGELRKRIQLTERAREFINYFKRQENGAVAVSPHFVANDVVGMELAQQIENVQVLSIANPGTSYKSENEIRTAYGIRVTPASSRALHEAAITIKTGGLMACGTDRAHQEEQYPVAFFGKTAHLPTVYTRLALRYNVPVFHFTGIMNEDMEYILDASEPIWLDRYPTHTDEIVRNTEKILRHSEAAIRQHPEQWGMFHAIWQTTSPEQKEV